MTCSKVIKETKNRECLQPRLGYFYVNTSKSRSENSCFSLSPTINMKAIQMKAFWWDRHHESHQLRCDGRRDPIISGSFTHFMIYIHYISRSLTGKLSQRYQRGKGGPRAHLEMRNKEIFH